jgi:hypothetical protein
MKQDLFQLQLPQNLIIFKNNQEVTNIINVLGFSVGRGKLPINMSNESSDLSSISGSIIASRENQRKRQNTNESNSNLISDSVDLRSRMDSQDHHKSEGMSSVS